ncbi:hypothetical protein SAV31267_045170 [Streptomyces avermitilis]|uniref:NACHT N-terminal Helical domain-containing protein n=1 Tax=Streptomyces avermitilis TaxID=33903 RepID=A0A4D4MS80_STRAX|nr:hypothetical protein SAV31267_045170 [Streptomyces avermitilis]
MEAASIGVKLASSVVTPLVKKLFVAEGPGAGLVEKPVRVSEFVSFKGEKRALAEKELTKLAAELVRRAVKSEGERPLPVDEEPAVVHALARTLHSLGDLDMTDVQAVRLGHQTLALHLRVASEAPDRHLSLDATLFYERLLENACLHILHFFTQRSTFVARTLVEQTRRQSELIAKIDELIARTPPTGGTDPSFEERYLAYVATKHSRLTIYGIDLVNSPSAGPSTPPTSASRHCVPRRTTTPPPESPPPTPPCPPNRHSRSTTWCCCAVSPVPARPRSCSGWP